jgi:rubrerythrin
MKSKRAIIVTDENRFSTNFPELLKEWDYPKNNTMGWFPDKIKKASSIRAHWICEKCGNEWQTKVATRTSPFHPGCPKCNIGLSNKYEDNYISKKFPHLLKEWDYEKNSKILDSKGNPVTSDTYKAFTRHKFWWICPDCGHSYQQLLVKRTKANIGCPICRRKEIIIGRRIVKCIDCGVEFDYKIEFPWNNSKQHFERCKICRDKYNEQKRIDGKIKAEEKELAAEERRQKKVLKLVDPTLFECIHPTKNHDIKNIDTLFITSSKKLWFICPRCGRESSEYIYNMFKRHACKKCVATNASSIERKFYYFIESIFGEDDVENTYSFTTKNKKRIEIDIFIKSLNLGIEYDGVYFHAGKFSQDKQKNDILTSHGVDIIRIRETGLNKLREEDVIYEFDKKGFKKALYQIFWYIQRKYKLTLEQGEILKNFLHQDLENYNLPVEYLVYPLKKNSFLQKHPSLAHYWDKEKNGVLTPDMVSHASTKKVFFKCKECGQSFLASPHKLVSRKKMGCLCQDCINKKTVIVNIVKNIIESTPELIHWFDQDKNKDYRLIGYCSNEDVYWKCPDCGHEFKKRAYLMTSKAETQKKFKIRKRSLCPNEKNHEDWIDPKIFYKRKERQYKEKYKEKRNAIANRNKKIDIKHPELIPYWSDNNKLSPSQVEKYDNVLIKWKCPDCNFEWEETPLKRIEKIKHCPNCKPIIKKFSIASRNSKLLLNFNRVKNAGINPNIISSSSLKVVWWKCHICNHEWQATPNSLTRKDRYDAHKCPNCRTVLI